tara:strand:+ start:143 stop:409 length:267 start_codon:yes stop_codon:yes gene_type:complete
MIWNTQEKNIIPIKIGGRKEMGRQNKILAQEINALENSQSVGEFIDWLLNNNKLDLLQKVSQELHDQALERIIGRTQDVDKIIERGKV